jgi:hypothetical protein
MKNSLSYRFFILVGTISAMAAFAQAFQSNHREFSRTKEKELKVLLDVSFGNISIVRGEQDIIAAVDYDIEETDKRKFLISYDISNEIGILRIKLKESKDINYRFWNDNEDRSGHRRHLDIKLSDAVPISFEVELGAGTGDIDLTDLQVKDLKISTGASSVTLKCSKPNPIFTDDVTFESGVSKFTALDLGNLNFRNLKFSGGVGSYKLDFNGKFRQSAEVQIEVGLGSINVYIPKTIPTKLVYDDNWLSSFNLDDDFEKQRSGVYETEDFQDAFKRLTIRLESGLGSVKIRRK